MNDMAIFWMLVLEMYLKSEKLKFQEINLKSFHKQ